MVLTAFAQAEYAAAAYRLGAAALVLKTAPMPELVAAIRAAALGEPVEAAPGPRATDPTLTTREQEIVRLVVDGRSNDEIGAALGDRDQDRRGPPAARVRAPRHRVAGGAVGESRRGGVARGPDRRPPPGTAA